MAAVYILYSESLDRFYVGSCLDVDVRLDQHLSEYFPKAYTSTAKDWVIYLSITELSYTQARNIESHIKRMKSRKYIENLKKYPELQVKLSVLYKDS